MGIDIVCWMLTQSLFCVWWVLMQIFRDLQLARYLTQPVITVSAHVSHLELFGLVSFIVLLKIWELICISNLIRVSLCFPVLILKWFIFYIEKSCTMPHFSNFECQIWFPNALTIVSHVKKMYRSLKKLYPFLGIMMCVCSYLFMQK